MRGGLIYSSRVEKDGWKRHIVWEIYRIDLI